MILDLENKREWGEWGLEQSGGLVSDVSFVGNNFTGNDVYLS